MFSLLIFFYNLVVSLYRGEPAGDNPWQGWSLEWATSSPPPPHNFDKVMRVRHRRPLWDLQHPDMPEADWSMRREAASMMDKNKMAMLLFIASEAIFFAMLVIASLLSSSP